VALGFFARERERTCAESGYTWLVPCSIARRGIRGISGTGMAGMAGIDAGAMIRSPRRNPPGAANFNAMIQARAEQTEGFRTCAKCGADDFTQRPAPRR
jgi:hypothetical protein